MMKNDPTPYQRKEDLVDAVLGRDPITVCNRLIALLADAAHGWRVGADATARWLALLE